MGVRAVSTSGIGITALGALGFQGAARHLWDAAIMWIRESQEASDFGRHQVLDANRAMSIEFVTLLDTCSCQTSCPKAGPVAIPAQVHSRVPSSFMLHPCLHCRSVKKVWEAHAAKETQTRKRMVDFMFRMDRDDSDGSEKLALQEESLKTAKGEADQLRVLCRRPSNPNQSWQKN